MAAEGKQGPLNDLVLRFTGPGARDRVGALARRHAAAERRADALARRRQDLGVDLGTGRDRLSRHRDARRANQVIALRVDQPDVQVSSDGGKTFKGGRPRRWRAPSTSRSTPPTPSSGRSAPSRASSCPATPAAPGASARRRSAPASPGPRRTRSTAPGWTARCARAPTAARSWEEVRTIGAGPKDFVALPGRQALRLRPRRQDPPLGGRRQDLDRPRHLALTGVAAALSSNPATPTLETWRFIAASTPPILAASVSGASTKSAGFARG